MPVTAGGEGNSPVARLEEHFLHEPGHHLLRPLGAGQGRHLALQVFVAARLAVWPTRGVVGCNHVKHKISTYHEEQSILDFK